MNHPIDCDPEIYRRENSKHLKLLEKLIDNIIKRLEDNSCQPKVRDALKAIQLREKVAKTSEVERSETHRAEKFFWEEIESIRRSELPKLYPEPTSLEAQIQETILGLKDLVKNRYSPTQDHHRRFQSSQIQTRAAYLSPDVPAPFRHGIHKGENTQRVLRYHLG